MKLTAFMIAERLHCIDAGTAGAIITSFISGAGSRSQQYLPGTL
jgi:hypothetical protein